MHNAKPISIKGSGSVEEVEFEYTETSGGKLKGTGETFKLQADQVFKAIGQTLEGAPESMELEGKKIKVNDSGMTSLECVWAGGDCASGGDDLTVTAVAEGRDAAIDIHAR